MWFESHLVLISFKLKKNVLTFPEFALYLTHRTYFINGQVLYQKLQINQYNRFFFFTFTQKIYILSSFTGLLSFPNKMANDK